MKIKTNIRIRTTSERLSVLESYISFNSDYLQMQTREIGKPPFNYHDVRIQMKYEGTPIGICKLEGLLKIIKPADWEVGISEEFKKMRKDKNLLQRPITGLQLSVRALNCLESEYSNPILKANC